MLYNYGTKNHCVLYTTLNPGELLSTAAEA